MSVFQARDVQRRIKRHDADNHHQIGSGVHGSHTPCRRCSSSLGSRQILLRQGASNATGHGALEYAYRPNNSRNPIPQEAAIAAIKDDFEKAQADVKTLKEKPDNNTLLELYALYKQGSEGDATGRRPGIMDPVGRAKFGAWAARKAPATMTPWLGTWRWSKTAGMKRAVCHCAHPADERSGQEASPRPNCSRWSIGPPRTAAGARGWGSPGRFRRW